MDDLTLPIVQVLFGAIPGLLAGGVTAIKLMKLVADVVLIVGKTQLENTEKLSYAVSLLYQKLPTLFTWIPKSLMKSIIEFVWHNLVKPSLMTEAPKR